MGLATAKLLASRGAIISLADINGVAVKAAAESLTNSEKHIYTVVDVCESRSVNHWITSTVQKLGKLDGAVNMAGIITAAKPVAEETDETWDFNFAVNTRGVFFCMRAEIREMLKAGGSIVSLQLLGRFSSYTIYSLPSCLYLEDVLTLLTNRSLRPVLLAKWAHPALRHTVPAKRL